MRIGILADIHGNFDALEAVWTALQPLACDRIVNLGDCLSGPLEADRTADFLMERPEWITVRGNHDRQLLDRGVAEMGASDRAAFELLRPEHFDWLRTLPFDAGVDGKYLCHATPQSDLQYLLEEVGPDGRVALASGATIRDRLAAAGHAIILHGHTHIPRLVQLQDALLVNPGSVGLPAYDDVSPAPHYMETGSPHARFAVLDGTQATFHTVEYDWQRASALAARRGRPDWAHALATGFALRG